jgi:hypothetical protein
VNIAKLPSVPRQILKDIPRPPNSASQDGSLFQSPAIHVPDVPIACTAGPIDAERMCIKISSGLMSSEDGTVVGGKIT